MAEVAAHTLDQLLEHLRSLKGPNVQRVWGYVRVSTKGQEDGESPEVQKRVIQEYCRKLVLGEPAFVIEAASGAKPMFDFSLKGRQRSDPAALPNTSPRPMFFQLLSYIEETPDSHLVFWKLDRLSRHDIDQELILRQLWAKSVNVYSTFESERHLLIDGGQTNDPQRDFFRAIMAATHVYERKMIQMRLDLGRDNKADRGEFVGGRPPFGYRAKDGELAIHPYEAQMVRLIFRLRHEFGLSSSKIVDYLNKNKDERDPTTYRKNRILAMFDDDRRRMYCGWYKDHRGLWHRRPDLKIIESPQETYDERSPSAAGQRDPEQGSVRAADGPIQGRNGDLEDQEADSAARPQPDVDGGRHREGVGGESGVDPDSVREPGRESIREDSGTAASTGGQLTHLSPNQE